MGTDKGLKLLHQKPIICYLLETLQQLDLEIKIIAHHQAYQQFKLTTIEDIYQEKGPLGGIFTALNDAKNDCLILSVDTPFMSVTHIKKLLESHQQGELTLAYSATKIYPLFGIYPYLLAEKIEENIKQNQLKLIQFIHENHYQTVEFDFSLLEKININTIEELKTAEKILTNGN